MNEEEERQVRWRAWLAEKPECVRETALKYPPGTSFLLHEQIMHVIGYDENVQDKVCGLLLSPIDPAMDFAAAVANQQPICLCCVGKLDEWLPVAMRSCTERTRKVTTSVRSALPPATLRG